MTTRSKVTEKKWALISVSDKTHLTAIAAFLHQHNVGLLASSSSKKHLQNQNIPCESIADYTQFPEIMTGRVKTLHPKIYGGILGQSPQDNAVMEQHSIRTIDFVIVNFYPFIETISASGFSHAEAIEKIDIGGPCLVRAAAKNNTRTTVIIDPNDYASIIAEMQTTQGQTTQQTRLRLATKAFEYTAYYDAAIAQYLRSEASVHQNDGNSNQFPNYLTLGLKKKQQLRYGENPHQQAAFYENIQASEPHSITNAHIHQGKSLSYNNIADVNAAIQCVQQWPPQQAACVIIKHTNPCGVAVHSTLLNAYQNALSTNPKAAFGGIIAFNQPLDEATATAIMQQPLTEIIAAPRIENAALIQLQKKSRIRVISYGTNTTAMDTATTVQQITSVAGGGLLVQEKDTHRVQANALQIATKHTLSETQRADLLFAWNVAKHTKSNAIVCAKNGITLGVGAGQVSRVASLEIAIKQALDAKKSTQEAVIASDAFFPFSDAIEIAAAAGISAIIQPGGSVRDPQIIQAANQYDVAMVFTHIRHFCH